jgi:hypothetical protein
MFIVIFYSYETRIEDNKERASSLSFVFFLALEKTMMGLPTHRHLLQLKKKEKKHKKPEKDDKFFDLSSSSATQEKKHLMLVFLGL